jgi:coenzyme F420 hydrogenase subunit beta
MNRAGEGYQQLARQIRSIQDVVDWGLCTGCGACYYACSKSGVSLVNIEAVGIRPHFHTAKCAGCKECLSICPGYQVDADLATGEHAESSEGDHEVGYALEIWEGYAADPEIRRQASSGGLLSALALYCLEKEGMGFVLHTAMDEIKPWTNKTVQSRDRSEILARTGSRYAPASPCDELRLIEESARPCVFIGKPCDTAAVAMLREKRPALDRNLGLVLTFFCAGTPSTKGTLDLMKSLNVSPEKVASVRYRGDGWPGRFRVISANDDGEKSFSYRESWSRLSHDRAFRCQLCPDGLGRVADISCGDAWERFVDGQDIGRSVAVVRTRRGQEILHRALAARYVDLEPVGATAIPASQPSQINRNREVFGRLLAMRLLMVPVPNFTGFSLFRSWMRLPFLRRIRTILGSIRRLVLRKLWIRHPIV